MLQKVLKLFVYMACFTVLIAMVEKALGGENMVFALCLGILVGGILGARQMTKGW